MTASLVTGGGGFIGRHLVRRLGERGETVRVLDLAPAQGMEGGIEFFGGSVCDPAAVRRALKGMDRLYHLAGNPDLWVRPKSEFYRVNHLGTRTVLEAAAGADLERIVYTSTESILRGRNGANPVGAVDEAICPRLEDMPGPYCRSKLLADREALAAAEAGLPVVVVNPTLPVGPGDYRLTPPTRMIVDFINGRSQAFLDCEINLIDVRDVAEGHILAAEHGRVGERYILGNENLRLARVIAMLQELTALPMPRLEVPYWLALGFGALSEFVADHVTGRPPLAPLTGVRLAGAPMRFDSSKAVRELGLPQSPISRALADAVAWLDAKGHLHRSPCRPLRRDRLGDWRDSQAGGPSPARSG